MPYKNPEDKRKWEREHREQRNARRRMQRPNAWSGYPSITKPAPDPLSNQDPQNTWKTILGWAIGIGVVLLAAFGGIDAAPPRMARR
jgi:hypothetical protein